MNAENLVIIVVSVDKHNTQSVAKVYLEDFEEPNKYLDMMGSPTTFEEWTKTVDLFECAINSFYVMMDGRTPIKSIAVETDDEKKFVCYTER